MRKRLEEQKKAGTAGTAGDRGDRGDCGDCGDRGIRWHLRSEREHEAWPERQGLSATTSTKRYGLSHARRRKRKGGNLKKRRTELAKQYACWGMWGLSFWEMLLLEKQGHMPYVYRIYLNQIMFNA